MFFNKKSKKSKIKCSSCNSSLENKFNFCPYCGLSLLDKEEELKDFGLLGRKDFIDKTSSNTFLAQSGSGITDKIVNSIINNLMKNLDKQIKEANPNIKNFPSGIKIQIAGPEVKRETKAKQAPRKAITEEQIERMSSLPREAAKSTIKRLSNKIICELTAPGIQSPNDIFISKLEKGYEIKAIGEKKVYTNSIPVDLPLKGLALDEKKIYVEFNTQEE